MVLKQIPHASLQGANRSRFAKATCILDRLPRVPPRHPICCSAGAACPRHHAAPVRRCDRGSPRRSDGFLAADRFATDPRNRLGDGAIINRAALAVAKVWHDQRLRNFGHIPRQVISRQRPFVSPKSEESKEGVTHQG
jgi:hypothetical protein